MDKKVTTEKGFLLDWAQEGISRIAMGMEQAHPQQDIEILESKASVGLSRQMNRLNPFLQILSLGWLFWFFVCMPIVFLFSYLISLPRFLFDFDQWLGFWIAPIAIGYGTNWLAIKMLFHPRFENPIWQGLIPARRKELIQAIAKAIQERLVSAEIIEEYLQSTGLLQKLGHLTLNEIEHTIHARKFQEQMNEYLEQEIRKLLGEKKTRDWLKDFLSRIIHETNGKTWGPMGGFFSRTMMGAQVDLASSLILEVIPDFSKDVSERILLGMESFPDKLRSSQKEIEDLIIRGIVDAIRSLSLQKIILSRLETLDEAELENLLVGNVVQELVFIQVMGGVFGFLIALGIYFVIFRFLLFGIILFGWYKIHLSKLEFLL